MKFATERQKQLFLSSVLLKKIGRSNLPVAMATGCLVEYQDKHLLLTVSHATGDQGKWALELRYDPRMGKTALYSLGPMQFLKKGSLKLGTVEDIDFSYTEVPQDVRAYRQEIVNRSEVKDEMPVTVHRIDLDVKPSTTQKYGFCGAVLPSVEIHHEQNYLFAELKIYDDLSYLRSEDDYHIFKLPEPHPGDEQFQGCSGAPVIDNEGRVVGLVCSGEQSTDEIWAISVARYRTALDVFVGNIR